MRVKISCKKTKKIGVFVFGISWVIFTCMLLHFDGGALGIPDQPRKAGCHPGLACRGPCQVVPCCGGWPAPCGYPDWCILTSRCSEQFPGGCFLHASSYDGGALAIPDQPWRADYHPGGPCQVVPCCGGEPVRCGYSSILPPFSVQSSMPLKYAWNRVKTGPYL